MPAARHPAAPHLFACPPASSPPAARPPSEGPGLTAAAPCAKSALCIPPSHQAHDVFPTLFSLPVGAPCRADHRHGTGRASPPWHPHAPALSTALVAPQLPAAGPISLPRLPPTMARSQSPATKGSGAGGHPPMAAPSMARQMYGRPPPTAPCPCNNARLCARRAFRQATQRRGNRGASGPAQKAKGESPKQHPRTRKSQCDRMVWCRRCAPHRGWVAPLGRRPARLAGRARSHTCARTDRGAPPSASRNVVQHSSSAAPVQARPSCRGGLPCHLLAAPRLAQPQQHPSWHGPRAAHQAPGLSRLCTRQFAIPDAARRGCVRCSGTGTTRGKTSRLVIHRRLPGPATRFPIPVTWFPVQCKAALWAAVRVPAACPASARTPPRLRPASFRGPPRGFTF